MLIRGTISDNIGASVRTPPSLTGAERHKYHQPTSFWIRGLSETNQRQTPVSPSVISHVTDAWSGCVKNGSDAFVLLYAMLKVAAWYLTVKQPEWTWTYCTGSANLLTKPALVPYTRKLLFQLTKQHLRSHVSNNGRSVRPMSFLLTLLSLKRDVHMVRRSKLETDTRERAGLWQLFTQQTSRLEFTGGDISPLKMFPNCFRKLFLTLHQ